MATQIDLGGISFNTGVPDGDGVLWTADLDGWDSPDLREDVTDKDFAHGQNQGVSYYGGRPLTLRGKIRAPSLALQRTARYALVAESNLTGSSGLLTVHESPSKQAAVRRSGRLGLKTVGERLVQFNVGLRAADPRKYATSTTTISIGSGATVAGTVGGDFDDIPSVITLTPGGGGMTLTETISGQVITVSTGAVVVVDAARHVVTVSGALAWARLTAGDFISLTGGDGYSFTTSGGSASVAYSAAWI